MDGVNIGTKIIGLTGNIGAGKSYVSKIFNEQYEIPIIDTDKLAKEVMNSDDKVMKQLTDLFGTDIYSKEGIINRELMASKIFNSSDLKKKVHDIISPAVKTAVIDWANNQDEPMVMVESAIIFESKITDWFYKVITVVAPMELRWKRVSERDTHRSEEELNKIINIQMSQEEKASNSNFVIVNSWDEKDLEKQIKAVNGILFDLTIRDYANRNKK